jgi:uncharacterized membrane protein SirB2
MYQTFKHVHSGFAYLSILLFLVRGLLMLAGKEGALQSKPLKILPHVIDTVLVVCALALLAQGGTALGGAWITAKVVGLLLYVALSTVALRLGKTKGQKAGAFVAALVVLVWVVKVAKSKVAF